MTKTPKIEPALTEKEWADAKKYGADNFRVDAGPLSWFEPSEVIALANAALPDTDPRKITRFRVEALRAAALALDTAGVNVLHAIVVQAMADVLSSYLPPETP